MTEIPQELVEKAAAALLQQAQDCGHTFPYGVDAYAHAVLAAVADDIRAQTRREVAEEYAALVSDLLRRGPLRMQPRDHDKNTWGSIEAADEHDPFRSLLLGEDAEVKQVYALLTRIAREVGGA